MPNDSGIAEGYYPPDLAKSSTEVKPIQDYFNVPVPNLKIDTGYSFQFQWAYADGRLSDWSPGYFVNTNTENVPSAPTVTVTGGAGFIQVTLPTFPLNASRVDVRIAGGIFGDGTKVADSFSSAGTKTIAAPGSSAPGLQYIVTLITVTPSKINGDPSSPTTVYVTDPSATLAVTPPQDPFAPTVRAGLASVIVEWSGKKSDGTDLTTTGFTGAKVHIGTSSGFVPSNDNWVHTLNFVNGSNRVSIGVGSIINKTSGATLEYGTEYYIKLVTTNASGILSNPVSASNNPVTVLRLPASEIDAGILRADAYIEAGVSGGQRAVLSGGTSPFIIYGTDGITKLLEYSASGTTGTLSIKGSGTFSGDISAASGTFAGNLSASSGTFSVNNGILTAQSGTIGGWNITGSVLESSAVSSNRITLNPATPKISLISGGLEKITIDPVEGIKHSSGNFVLAPNGSLSLTGAIQSGSTVTGADITMTGSTTGEGATTSTKLLFQSPNYVITAGTSTETYPSSGGYYDAEGDWISTSGTQTITNSDVRFTDATLGGNLPGANFYYGEMWLGSGSSGTVDLYANHESGWVSISLVANATTKDIIIKGDESAKFGVLHRSSISNEFSEIPASLQIDSQGRLTVGRALITGGSSNPNSVLGQTGDIYFSTAT